MEFFLLFLYTIGFIIFWKIVLIAYDYYIIRKKFCHIPGPIAYPILGTTPLLYNLRNEERIDYYLSLSNQFKDGLCVLWRGQSPLVCVYKPEIYQRILSGTANIMKPKQYDLFALWLGNGILTAPVEQWHRDRKLIEPTFSFTIMEQFAVTMSQITEDMIKWLEKKIAENPNKAIDIIPILGRLATDITLGKKQCEEQI